MNFVFLVSLSQYLELLAHPLAQKLLHAAAIPIAAPSANRYGHVSPTTAKHVIADLGDKDVRILNGESDMIDDNINCEYGVESTVLKIDGANRRLILLRQGAVSRARLEKTISNLLESRKNDTWTIQTLIKRVKMDYKSNDDSHITDEIVPASNKVRGSSNIIEEEEDRGQEAPGQAITHYAPDVSCYLLRSLEYKGGVSSCRKEATINRNLLEISVSELKNSCVLIDFGKRMSRLEGKTLAYRDLSVDKNISNAARNLFACLRWAEEVEGAKRIFIPMMQLERTQRTDDIDETVADRLYRAASGVKIDLVLAD